jgi:hypothetical protein
MNRLVIRPCFLNTTLRHACQCFLSTCCWVAVLHLWAGFRTHFGAGGTLQPRVILGLQAADLQQTATGTGTGTYTTLTLHPGWPSAAEDFDEDCTDFFVLHGWGAVGTLQAGMT